MLRLEILRGCRDGTLRVDGRIVAVDVRRVALTHELIGSTLALIVAYLVCHD